MALQIPIIDWDLDISVTLKETLLLAAVVFAAVALGIFKIFSADQVLAVIGMVFAYGFGRAYVNGNNGGK